MRTRYIALLLAICLVLPGLATNNVQGFLQRNGNRIANDANQNYILRGIGPGGWMLQEGYMFKTPVGPQYQIKSMLQNLTDSSTTEAFYNAWLTNFFTQKDVERIHDWGFNSIRIPLHYNLFTLPVEEEPVPGKHTWLVKGFTLLDSLLHWCEKHDLYLILDLHAAPGGQGKDANISDYNPDKPSLWESEANQAKTVALWHQLARRYAGKEHIGGFDLINEPNWAFANDGQQPNGCDCAVNAPLLELYKRITDTIRLVNTRHLIFVEGNCWANNYKGLHSLAQYDKNLVFSFHKYWSHNSDNSIQGILQLREDLKVPIWLGETGENSNTWFTEMVEQMERLEIGWATWAYKQMDIDDPYTIISKSWEAIVQYNPKTGENTPTEKQVRMAMNDLLENIKTENCKFNADVVFAYLQAPFQTETTPFKVHCIPGTIFATDYDLGKRNAAWHDTDYQDLHVSSGTYTAWNSGYAYRSDGVDIKLCSDPITNGYCIGWTEDGEWTRYTLTDVTPGLYRVILRVSGHKGALKLEVGETSLVAAPNAKPEKPEAGWYDLTLENVRINKHTQTLKLISTKGGFDINYIKFEQVTETEAALHR